MPFLYNLDASVEGLDVIDFPGVDDRDETIPDLAELLLALVQVVVFVVDYKYVVVLVASFPGSHQMQTKIGRIMESWAGPGNEAVVLLVCV